jgi:hypothetical protein
MNDLHLALANELSRQRLTDATEHHNRRAAKRPRSRTLARFAPTRTAAASASC